MAPRYYNRDRKYTHEVYEWLIVRDALGRVKRAEDRLEAGETAADPAVRELMEEAGIEGDLVEFVDALEFIGRGGPLHLQYFLIRARGSRSDGEPSGANVV
jgi:8-oxo-dGTP pyrophosphatase MutT (NUDIX family)